MSDGFELSTAPVDVRFPNTNQNQHCWTRFLEYHKCAQTKDDAPECAKFKKYYLAICPNDWVENVSCCVSWLRFRVPRLVLSQLRHLVR